ncbi:phage associated protein [Streptococcus equi subsp. equi]|nr:phage associated protein [Streptococcus equi subsp. equi]
MGAKEQLKELKPLFALMTLFEEQRDKNIKLINTFHNLEVLKDMKKVLPSNSCI